MNHEFECARLRVLLKKAEAELEREKNKTRVVTEARGIAEVDTESEREASKMLMESMDKEAGFKMMKASLLRLAKGVIGIGILECAFIVEPPNSPWSLSLSQE